MPRYGKRKRNIHRYGLVYMREGRRERDSERERRNVREKGDSNTESERRRQVKIKKQRR